MRWIALAVLVAQVALSIFAPETANTLLVGLKDDVVAYFDWLFVFVASAALVLAIFLGRHPRANLRLGNDGDEPEFSRFSWFAMLFSAGLASRFTRKS